MFLLLSLTRIYIVLAVLVPHVLGQPAPELVQAFLQQLWVGHIGSEKSWLDAHHSDAKRRHVQTEKNRVGEEADQGAKATKHTHTNKQSPLIDSPQVVIEGLHAVLADAVGAAEGADPAEHAGDVHHPAPRPLDEREDAQRHVDDAAQVDGQHGLVVLDGEPVGGRGGQGDAGVVDDGPQACSNRAYN